MLENQQFDKKSLLLVTRPSPDWNELAKDCVCFANSFGGTILIGIEKDDDLPPDGQKIPDELVARIIKQIQCRTINIGLMPQVKTAENGAEYIELLVQPSCSSIASTSRGRYYVRVSDDCKPVLPDELGRLMVDRNAFVWETQVTMKIERNDYDRLKLEQFISNIRNSERISRLVKEKNPVELMEYYLFANGDYLTNLGILWIGKREHRASLMFAPIIQFIKYDETDNKVNKIVWDDFTLNPKEIIEAVWQSIPDWQEGIDFPDGIFRQRISNYDEVVVRELLANALVHRPYSIRGDIFIKLYPDRLEIHNPGLLPLGVTPSNILHQSVKRNIHLAKVFYDLKLMEAEGSGYDRMYEVLLSSGKQIPVPKEEDDRVFVTVSKRIINREVIRLMDLVNQKFQLKTRELISLGLIAQHNSLTAIEFSNILGLKGQDAVGDWLGRLTDLGLVQSKGRTKGKAYFINPEILQQADFKGITNLKKIEPLRLRELITEVLKTYGESSISDINKRIGSEIPEHRIRTQLKFLLAEGRIHNIGEKRWRRYFI
jgi:ATP-dependent DNA helicase RecG